MKTVLVALLFAISMALGSQAQAQAPKGAEQWFLDLLIGDENAAAAATAKITTQWDASLIPMTLESIYLGRDQARAAQLFKLLEQKTGQEHGFDIHAWWKWVWNNPELRHPGYATFKSKLYGLLDAKFAGYFDPSRATDIRLDEVVWGGVVQDGIPPLRSPKMISATQAGYLEDDNVIFGLAIDGDVRAYPKRILAWHEMFVDVVGGMPVAGVYCTLCGSMILYKTTHGDTTHALGTSGFLYRSNKLMYDQATQSLWNTMWGRPVIGPLSGKGIELERLSIVTSTWGEWRRRHPDTQVLSLETGHTRDYSEGNAYREYFATDDLMFPVPVVDERLANKAEVLGLVFAEAPDEALAISAEFLAEHPLHYDTLGDVQFTVLTDASGANRVYRSGDVKFVSYDRDRSATDVAGVVWTLREAALTAADGRTLARLPAHRAFWFGWYSAYANTRLVSGL